MARTSKINYKRVTFSFPEKIVTTLRKEVGKNNMSHYIVTLIKDDLKTKKTDSNTLIEELNEFRASTIKKTKKSSLKILREIRYGKN